MPWYGLISDTLIPLTPDEIQRKADELTEMIVNEREVNLSTREVIYHAPGYTSPIGTVAVKIWGDE